MVTIKEDVASETLVIVDFSTKIFNRYDIGVLDTQKSVQISEKLLVEENELVDVLQIVAASTVGVGLFLVFAQYGLKVLFSVWGFIEYL